MKLTTTKLGLFLGISGLTALPFIAYAADEVSTNLPLSETNPPVLEEPAAKSPQPDKEGSNGPAAESKKPAEVFSTRSGEEVVFGHSVHVKPGESVGSLTVFGGSATVEGKVRGDTVVFGGNVDVRGEVNGDVVAFGGGVHLGTNAAVKGDVVTFLGGMRLETNSTIKGDAVAFGSGVDVEGGSVHGDIVPFNFLGKGAMGGLPRWLELWVKQCVFKLRPLAPQVGWVWVVAGAFFLVYLLIAAVFQRPVEVCVQVVTRRPITTLLLGLLTKLLIPVISLILVLTGIGVLVIPFLSMAVLLGVLMGKAVLLEYIGLSLGRQFGVSLLQKPIFGLIAGWLLITLLYMIPVLGLITFSILGMWSLGCVVTALFGGWRREMPPTIMAAPAMPSPSSLAGQGSGPGFASTGQAAESSPAATVSAPGSATATASASQFSSAGTAQPQNQPILPDVLALPKAGFWERMAAAFLDIILVSILAGLAGGTFSHAGHLIRPLVALAYFAGMWTWKGTTVGGIVLGLKVVRFDGQRVEFPVALVRALAAAFSVVVFFLGFLWIAWDLEKQGWHDKIAGTLVLKSPKGMPLVCL